MQDEEPRIIDETEQSQALEAIPAERKAGPRMSPSERDLLIKLLCAGEREGTIFDAFRIAGFDPPASSSISYYRAAYREEIQEARRTRLDKALTEGLALKAERVARLKEHAEALDSLKLMPDKAGRLWIAREWRGTLEDIASEMGERRPKEGEDRGEVIKILIGIDPDKV